jgi:hypothetical protein
MMEHYTLSDARRKGFFAISYTWQPTHPLRIIKMNGSRFEVGYNLFSFLLRLAGISGIGLLWADAIGIN